MWLSLGGLCAAVLSLAGTFLYLDPQVPAAETYRNVQLETPLRIYSKDGALLAEFGERRLIPITLEQVPHHFIRALIDTEDKRFYEHSGIDFISLTNDAFSLVGTLITDGELGPGASTITMQLARNVSFSLERRFLRKFKEMLLALKIERELTKDEILELYINLVPFGKRAYGAEAAARTYYGKSLVDLDVAQLAMLAGIPQAPSAANPINGPERAIARRNVVLSRMLDQGSITQTQFDRASQAPITARVFARDLDVASPYAAEWVRSQAATVLDDLYTGGYEIFTTVDAESQNVAIRALRNGLIAYDKKHGYRGAEAVLPEELLNQMQQPTSQQPAFDEADNELYAALVTHLAAFTPHAGLLPGIVVEVAVDKARVLHEDGIVELVLEDNLWARPYENVDLRGPIPESFSDIISVGDVVRITQSDDTWLLSQLPDIQGALVALDPKTGKVRSLVGGFDFFRNQYNHALQAARQPGSGFKPFVYSAALEEGITPADIFMDAPLVFDDENLESQYRPSNDNNKYNGPTRLRVALYRSINLVSMQVLLKAGAGDVLDHVARFGFGIRDFPRNTQLAIGGGTMAVTPMQMATAYAVFANGGFLIEPNIIERIHDSDGNEIFTPVYPQVCPDCESEQPAEADAEEPASLAALLGEAALSKETLNKETVDEETLGEETHTDANGASVGDPGAEDTAEGTTNDTNVLDPPAALDTAGNAKQIQIAPRVLDERNAFIMHTMMQDVIRRGTGVRAKSLGRNDLAGKTGTTNDAADTWFNGYHPDLVTIVWVGFSNHEPLGARAYGSNTPLPIWMEYMSHALKDIPEHSPTQPPGVLSMRIDAQTGAAATANNPRAIFEYFFREFAPKRTPGNDREVQPKDEPGVTDIELF